MAERRSRRWSLVVYEKELHDMKINKLETSKVTKESVESTRRMLQLMNECEDAGVNTLRMLHNQGEALDRTQGTLDEINADLKDGEKTLKRISFMNKVPLIVLPLYLMFKRKPPPLPSLGDDKSPVLPKTKNKNQNSGVPNSKPKSFSKSLWRGSSKGKFMSFQDDDCSSPSGDNLRNGPTLDQNENTDRFFMRITGDEDEDEIESNLSVVSKHLAELKEHAILIGSTVTTQNVQLDHIHTKAENNQGKMADVNRKTRKLLGSNDSSDSIPGTPTSCLRCVIS